jgi:UDP-glucose 4-epimerase
MSLYLITGGAGFIGSNLVAALVQQGEHVRILDNFSMGRYANVAPFVDYIEIFEGDICDYATVLQATHGVDYVLHHAALVSVEQSVQEPIVTNAININGTLNVLQAAHISGVKRLVFASSSAVYGDSAALPASESLPPEPLSPYAVSKLTGEYYCQVFNRLYDLETVCLRYFNVFGPRQNLDSQYAAVIPRFINALLQQQPVTVYGDGLQSRDFIFVDNVVQANLAAVTVPSAAGVVCNIAAGVSCTLLDVIDQLATIIGQKPDIHFASARSGDVRHSQAGIDRAQAVLGYYPNIPFARGLQQTVNWFQCG